MTEAQEEQAALYVLGLLPEDEARAMELEMRRDPAVAALVASLNNATLSLAQSAPSQPLPPELKQRLLESITPPAERIVPFRRNRILSFIPWAAAACLAGLLYQQFNTTLGVKKVLQASLHLRATERRTAEEALTAAQTTGRDLLSRITALEQKDFIAQAKIAVLGSLIKDRPQAVAVSLWDQEKQNGLLVVENLPVLQSGKDYQLWVIDPSISAPVSAGVFKVDAQGKVRMTFRPQQVIASAAKFAVTEEREGGALSPTMDQMVVIGGSPTEPGAGR